MEKNDGGPIHPVQTRSIAFKKGHEDCAQEILGKFSPGMTLRQWYAGMASQGICANADVEYRPVHLAAVSFEIADALLKFEAEEKTK